MRYFVPMQVYPVYKHKFWQHPKRRKKNVNETFLVTTKLYFVLCKKRFFFVFGLARGAVAENIVAFAVVPKFCAILY